VKRLPKESGYQSYEFGARSYPNSLCSGGRLFDADDCDSDGPSEDIPCTICLKKSRSIIGLIDFRSVVRNRQTQMNPRRVSWPTIIRTVQTEPKN